MGWRTAATARQQGRSTSTSSRLTWPRTAWGALAVLLLAACAGGASDGSDRSARADAGGDDDAARQGEGTEEQPAAPSGPFPVGRRSLELVDSSRPTDAVADHGLAAADERTIAVTLVYPADPDSAGDDPEATADDREHATEEPASDPAEAADPGDSEPADSEGAEGSAEPSVVDAPMAEGPFPLVVFAHGHNGTGELFTFMAEWWARAGYVVALPTFPLSRGPIGNSDDYVNQPGDVSFVIDELVGRSRAQETDEADQADEADGADQADGAGDDPLAGRIDADRIAVGGHSLGSATVIGAAYNSCCTDERIDAVIAISGGPLEYDGGDYDHWPATPLLLVHGARDPIVPIGAGDLTFDMAEPPVHYLRFAEADHGTLFGHEDGELLRTATVAFLDAELKDQSDALDDLVSTVEPSGRAELRVKT